MLPIHQRKRVNELPLLSLASLARILRLVCTRHVMCYQCWRWRWWQFLLLLIWVVAKIMQKLWLLLSLRSNLRNLILLYRKWHFVVFQMMATSVVWCLSSKAGSWLRQHFPSCGSTSGYEDNKKRCARLSLLLPFFHNHLPYYNIAMRLTSNVSLIHYTALIKSLASLNAAC